MSNAKAEEVGEMEAAKVAHIIQLMKRSNFYANLVLKAAQKKQKRREKKLEIKLYFHDLEIEVFYFVFVTFTRQKLTLDLAHGVAKQGAQA